MIPDRLNDHAAEEDLPLHHQAFHRLADGGIIGVRRESTCQRRANELGGFDVERFLQARDDRLVGVALEVRVGDGTHPVVPVGGSRKHDLARPRIVEAGEEDQRAKADVLIRVLLDRGQERGYRHRRIGAAHGASS